MASNDRIGRRRAELAPAQRALLEQRLRGQGGESTASSVIRRRTPTANTPLSFAQERLWFLDQLTPGDTTFNCVDTLALDFAVDVAILQRTLNEIVRRHESLRTTFQSVGGVPVQVVAPSLHLALPVIDLRHLPKARREDEVRRLATEEAERAFDLETGPLVRTALLRTGDRRYVFLLATHHIVSDGWSMGIFWKELTVIWEAFEAGRPSPLPELSIQYADFAAWQRSTVSGAFLDAHLTYWRQQLQGLPLLNMPSDRLRPAVPSFRGAKQAVVVRRSLTAALNEVSQRQGATLFMTLLAAFEVLLYRYADQEKFAVGTYLAGRNRRELEDLIGFFINTLVMRADMSGDPSFREVLTRVRDVALGAYSYQEMPFAVLVQELRPERDAGRNPLFQVLFHLFNAPNWDPRDFSADGSSHDVSTQSAAFDLVLTLVETREGLAGAFEYNVDLFDAPTIERMASHFGSLLEAIVENPDRAIGDLPLMSARERDVIVGGWNDTRRDYVDYDDLVALFERQVDRTPGATAFVCGDQALSYERLDSAASHLAVQLRQMGLGDGDLIGVMLPRSLDAVVSLLAILKAGAVYVPLDLAYPRARLGFMLQEAGVGAILTTRSEEPSVGGLSPRVICVDDASIGSTAEGRLSIRRRPEDLAYVIFTSGSTGQPKGVAVPHRQILNRLAWMREAYPLKSGEVSCHKTALSFVDSMWELLGPLLEGVKSVIVPDAVLKDPEALVDVLAEHAVSRIWLVPSLLRTMLDEVRELRQRVPALTFWVTTGEALPVELFRRFRKALPGCVLYNLYGTSEVWDATWYDPERDPIEEGRAGAVPIGRPISNVQAYILDRKRQPVPIGVHGDLYIAGTGLADRYLNQPQLTAERFVANPFSHEPGARMYKTGDIARYWPDGNIEYISRGDLQVKLRGFRIELGEVESVLAEHEGVRQAKVLVQEDGAGESRLVAYVVASPAGNGSAGEDALEAVPEWKEVWDETYRKPRLDGSATVNISGFSSSYTGLPIPAVEVREWVDQAVHRVLSSRPQTVLEIGCGTGLLLFRIAPHCRNYLGTDISTVAIDQLRRDVAAVGLTSVDVSARPADDFGGIAAESVDAVVINSVSQYFPSVQYLVRVLEGAVRVVKPGGVLFVGDVRSLPLLEAFHASVELYRAGDDLTLGRLRQRSQHRFMADEELVVDPALFVALRGHLEGIGDVEIRPKRGRYHNEFTCFRYDVALHKGPRTPSGQGRHLDWEDDRLSVAGLDAWLRQEQPDVVVVSRVPNRRLSGSGGALRFLRDADPSTTVGELRHYLRHAGSEGVDPEALWELGDAVPYHVDLSWSGPGADDRVDLFLITKDQPGTERSRRVRSFLDPEIGHAKPWSQYVNNPQHGRIMRRFVPDLSRFASERLPAYMIPSAFIVLDHLPVNPNGKLDRRSLPAADYRRSGASANYVAPRTDVEATLTTLFSESLGVDHVGANDDFFTDLQGHSLLATRLVSRIRETFRIEVPLRAIFETPTVAGLAQTIGELRRTGAGGEARAIEPLSRDLYARRTGETAVQPPPE